MDRELAGSATLSRIQAPSHREASIKKNRTVAERGLEMNFSGKMLTEIGTVSGTEIHYHFAKWY